MGGSGRAHLEWIDEAENSQGQGSGDRVVWRWLGPTPGAISQGTDGVIVGAEQPCSLARGELTGHRGA